LTPSKAQADDGDEPQRGSGRDTKDEIVPAEYRPASDETDTRQNAERQPHRIEIDKRVSRLSYCREQQIRLDHGDRSGEAHQERRAQARGTAALTAIDSNQAACDERERQTKRNFMQADGHDHVLPPVYGLLQWLHMQGHIVITPSYYCERKRGGQILVFTTGAYLVAEYDEHTGSAKWQRVVQANQRASIEDWLTQHFAPKKNNKQAV